MRTAQEFSSSVSDSLKVTQTKILIDCSIPAKLTLVYFLTGVTLCQYQLKSQTVPKILKMMLTLRMFRCYAWRENWWTLTEDSKPLRIGSHCPGCMLFPWHSLSSCVLSHFSLNKLLALFVVTIVIIFLSPVKMKPTFSKCLLNLFRLLCFISNGAKLKGETTTTNVKWCYLSLSEQNFCFCFSISTMDPCEIVNNKNSYFCTSTTDGLFFVMVNYGPMSIIFFYTFISIGFFFAMVNYG